MSLYERLGVAPDATDDVIKTAFRKLAQKHHPDKGGDHDTMQGIQEAYDILSDPERRTHYDVTGSTKPAPSVQDKAMAYLREALNEAIGKLDGGAENDLQHNDPIQAVRRGLNAGIKEGTEQQRRLTRAIEQRHIVLKRLKFEAQGKPDMLSIAVSLMITQAHKKMAEFEHTLQIMRAALDILADYDYEVAARPAKEDRPLGRPTWGFMAP